MYVDDSTIFHNFPHARLFWALLLMPYAVIYLEAISVWEWLYEVKEKLDKQQISCFPHCMLEPLVQ